MPAIIRNGHIYGASSMFPIGAGDITYDNTDSGLTATDAQDAIDELKELVDGNQGTTYTLGTSGNQVTLTPSEGQAQSITVPYATNAGTVNGHTVLSDVPANAVFTDTTDAADLIYSNTTSGLNATRVQNAIDEIVSNFQDGVDDVYDAVVAKGSTPASHSLADIVTGIGNIPNSNSGTYSFPQNDTGSIKDMGETNTNRYVEATNVYTKGWNDGKADHTATYKPTARASANDMGQTHSYRYVNTTEVPNSNSGTQSVSANGIVDMGATNTQRYVNVNVPHPTHTATYTPTSRASNCDMGATHNYRYVNTNSVPNSNSGTYSSITSNGTHDLGATNTYKCVTVNVPHPAHSGTYTASSRSGALDMGASNTYRYVNTNGVPNSNSGTYGSVTSNGVKDMGASNSYRYVNVNVPNNNSGTYDVTSNGIKDMGASNSYRYANIKIHDHPYVEGIEMTNATSIVISLPPNSIYMYQFVPRTFVTVSFYTKSSKYVKYDMDYGGAPATCALYNIGSSNETITLKLSINGSYKVKIVKVRVK